MFSIRTKAQKGKKEILLIVDGDIAGSDSERFRDKLEELVDDQCPGITLDLRGVAFMDSAGLGTLIYRHLKLKDLGKNMSVIVRPHSPLMELFENTKLVKLLTIVQLEG